MRSNSLETVGDIMAVAYQTQQHGQKPAGFELFDISVPESPKSIAFVDASGPGSRGVHQLWFCDGETVHMAAGAPDFVANNPLDDQFYRAFDVRNPSKPVEVSRWWMPGTRQGDAVPPPKRHKPPRYDMGFRAHNTNVYPQRPDRCYLGYIDGGMFILDISDMANPKPLCRWDNSPPFSGFTHTVLPLFERELLVVTDEFVVDDAKDWPKLIWILDGREETNPVPIATCPVDNVEDYAKRGGRFGAHNIHENVPLPTSWHSDRIILGTFFNGGLRAYDIANPYQPQEVGAFVPPAPNGAPTGAIQLNDVFVDERHHSLCRRPPHRRSLHIGDESLTVMRRQHAARDIRFHATPGCAICRVGQNLTCGRPQHVSFWHKADVEGPRAQCLRWVRSIRWCGCSRMSALPPRADVLTVEGFRQLCANFRHSVEFIATLG